LGKKIGRLDITESTGPDSVTVIKLYSTTKVKAYVTHRMPVSAMVESIAGCLAPSRGGVVGDWTHGK